MRFLKVVMPVVLAAGVLCAQDQPNPQPIPQASPAPAPIYDAVIIPVKTLTGDSFDRLVKLLNVFQVRMQSDDKLRVIVVYAPRDVVEKMRKVVMDLDQPGSEAAIGRNIDMTLTFLKCSVKTGPQPAALSADMEAVARQLRASTQYKDVQLWDTMPLHLQEGKDTFETLRLPAPTFNPAFNAPPVGIGTITIHPEGVTRKDQGRYVRFSKMNVDLNMPYATGTPTNVGWQMMRVDLNTSGDFMEGQKTVLGKVSGADEDTAIFVVISLKVLD